MHIISQSSCPHYNKKSLDSGLLIICNAVWKIPFYERTLQKYVLYIFVHLLIAEYEKSPQHILSEELSAITNIVPR